MPDLDEVYRKFGEVAEAAQLFETALGSLLFWEECSKRQSIFNPDPVLSRQIYDSVNKKTSGQLFSKLKDFDERFDNQSLKIDFAMALDERNRLFHSFYREHNFRRNSPQGCQIMLDDLEKMHDIILDAYKKLLLLDGIDLEKLAENSESVSLPTGHVKI